MKEINIRPMGSSDLPSLLDADASYHTDYVWQMEFESGAGDVMVRFRESRLPRSMRVLYPNDLDRLADEWNQKASILIAEKDDEFLGFLVLSKSLVEKTFIITDFVVLRRFRRQGVATSLLRAAHTWALQKNAKFLVLEVQSKNHPAIQMAYKLGFEFNGYSDRHFMNRDIGLFFAKHI